MHSRAHLGWIETTQDSRYGPRHKLHLEVELNTITGDALGATVLNLSSTGLLIETPAALSVGDEFEVVLPHTGTRVATIVWASDELYGCRFSEPLTAAGVSAALLRGEPVSSAVAHDIESSLQEQGYRPHVSKSGGAQHSRRAKAAIVLTLAALSWLIVAAIAALILL